MPVVSPRRIAFEILARIEKEHSYADILLNKELQGSALRGPDRALLTELVYGTLRRQGTLDHIVRQFSRTPLAKLERNVLHLLRLGLYQLFFLDRIPSSAAVNETVTLAHAFAPRASGFINAVLRQADRERDGIVYPDKEQDPTGYLATRYSHPGWIVEEWCSQLGVQEAEQLASAMSEQPPFTIRANTLKISREALLSRLAEEGVMARAGVYAPTAIHISGPVSLPSLQSFSDGLFTVQDEASQLASLFLGPVPGERVLDLCAAPGGKTTHLAQLMQNSGVITACDKTARKLRYVKESAERLGIGNIETVVLDGAAPSFPLACQGFDRVLVDAPCSGLGVLRRNPEGKWWKSRTDLTALAALQKNLLDHGAQALKDGGALLYATCSTTATENEAVIDDFLSRHPDVEREDLRPLFPHLADLFTDKGCFRSWPHRHGMDGFFAARLRRMK